MRHIDRLPKPQILAEKQDVWQEKFNEKRVENPKARPDSKKYGHPKIREMLNSCSHGKCFYCETIIKDDMQEIDHFKEVALAPELAYTWENLYLSCHKCNDKIAHDAIPVEKVLDPCKDSDEEIKKNITFDDECICVRHGSEKGLSTIKKFHLDSDILDLKRCRRLKLLLKEIVQVKDSRSKDMRQDFTDQEKERLLMFTEHNQPYSLMCEIYLRKYLPEIFSKKELISPSRTTQTERYET